MRGFFKKFSYLTLSKVRYDTGQVIHGFSIALYCSFTYLDNDHGRIITEMIYAHDNDKNVKR